MMIEKKIKKDLWISIGTILIYMFLGLIFITIAEGQDSVWLMNIFMPLITAAMTIVFHEDGGNNFLLILMLIIEFGLLTLMIFGILRLVRKLRK